MYQSWTKQSVLDEIQALHKNEGQINSAYVQAKHWRLYNAAVKHFGSWGKAITAAGFDYSKIKKKSGKTVIWTRERIIARILEIYQAEGRVNYKFVASRWPVVLVSACKQFGTYRAAVEAAGLSYDKIRVKNHRLWNKAKIVTKIKQRHQNGLPINSTAVHKEDQGLHVAARRHLGSWSRALRLAGFDPNKVNAHLLWSKNAVAVEIRTWFRLGLPLHHTFIQRNRHDLFRAAWRHCGGWAEAVARAGFNYEKIKLVRYNYWSKGKILKEIKRLEKEGVRLNVKAIKRDRGDLFATAWVLFGSWDQAVEAAGISYQAHCRVWSSKAWLRKIKPEEYQKVLEKAKTNAIRRNES